MFKVEQVSKVKCYDRPDLIHLSSIALAQFVMNRFVS